MEKNKQAEPTKESRGIDRISRWLVYIDDIILVLVAAGIIGVAVALVIEAASDFIYYSQHSISHIISDLMFVLIIMELFRQVLRQLTRHTFSLNPFLFIGIIASIRGLLLVQMKLAMGEAEWWDGVLQLGVHATIVLILVVSYYFYSKVEERPPNSFLLSSW
ncbi:MAG: hypothetical protein A2X87_02220 [Deltaproteobacteria bacterium GWC2_42_51]|nr:MAG: hypothetical protein A2X87_02220 [Deltaproteobacteria bacterium GWC2_42_51]OGP45936.1 MAG: hypothetical protein A2022_08070 [Deltaproteobacteria bacterium GWF2_42_12]OGQ24962.1 MAG: hypothetical protein A3D29_04085 [Deltaproteobacteria bacterium RIFCSPHIGHO2_02_FULL_42_44]OGQ37075.1 MAG: hypothetical protein A3H47_01410 [Deltaproteobacteria bacterium RIFCSPLOWO2_02_FULL_42_39]HAG51007.1 hypothetical protein [Deltaproteobacteria bacterium]